VTLGRRPAGRSEFSASAISTRDERDEIRDRNCFALHALCEHALAGFTWSTGLAPLARTDVDSTTEPCERAQPNRTL
jgi:hypothetical protein